MNTIVEKFYKDHQVKPFMTTFRRRISNRGYKLTPKGEQILEQYKGIINRHPKKNLYASDFWIDFL